MPVAVLMPRPRQEQTTTDKIHGLAALIGAMKGASDIYGSIQDRSKNADALDESKQAAEDFQDTGAGSTQGQIDAAVLSGKMIKSDKPGPGMSELLVQSEPYQQRQINGQDINFTDPRYAKAIPVETAPGKFVPVDTERKYVRSTDLERADSKNQANVDAANSKAEMALEIAKAKGGQSNIKIDGQNDRYNNTAHDRNLKAIEKDKPLNDLLTTRNNLVNASKTFEEGGRTPSEFAELQQAVRSNLGIKGAGGVDERKETYWKSLGLNSQKAKQFLFGNPEDVMSSSPEAVNQVLGLVRIELQNKEGQAGSRLQQLKAGKRTFYGKKGNEGLSEDYDSAGQAYIDQFTSATPVAQAIAPLPQEPGIMDKVRGFFSSPSKPVPTPDQAKQMLIQKLGIGANIPNK